MAQICGFQNHNRRTSIIPSGHENDNTFVTEEGVEFILHELEPNLSQIESGVSSKSSIKKRGRPRKDSIKEFENCEKNDSELLEEKLQKKREKREKRERKEREKLKKLEGGLSSNEFTPKKRGRPRKFKIINDKSPSEQSIHFTDRQIDFHVSSNTDDTLTPPYSDRSEGSVLGECSMMDMMNLDQELFGGNQEELITESYNLKYQKCVFNWSPVQRLMQLNQALAFTNMYKDFIFWDRIIAEFMLPSVIFRLEFNQEKSYDLPFLVISKMFWIFSQIGLNRLHFLHTGITEKLSEREDGGGGGVLFNSSDGFIYTHVFKDERLMIQHRTSQLIEFDSKSKISKWTIRFSKCEEFWKSTDDRNHSEDFIWGFPKRVFDYLDVALVMNSVLPDPASWLTWFYTYIHQNGLKNFSVVELSRPPSPFKFPTALNSVNSEAIPSQNNEMEFFDNGRDFIFSVLNSSGNDQINFDGVVEELMKQTENHQTVGESLLNDLKAVTPLENLFQQDTTGIYPELTEYPEFTETTQEKRDVVTQTEIDQFNYDQNQAEEEDFMLTKEEDDDQSLELNTMLTTTPVEDSIEATLEDCISYEDEIEMSVSEDSDKNNYQETEKSSDGDDAELSEELIVEISDPEDSVPANEDEDDFFDNYG